MRKVNVLEFVSLDGVMQALGGPKPVARAFGISDAQIPLTRLKKWNSCRFSVSGTTI